MRSTAAFVALLPVLSIVLVVGPAAAGACGTGITVDSVSPEGTVPVVILVVRAVFQDTGDSCFGSSSMKHNNFGKPHKVTYEDSKYVLEFHPNPPIGPGTHTFEASVEESCCNSGGGEDSASILWTVVVTQPGGEASTQGVGVGVGTPDSVTVGPVTTIGGVSTPGVESKTVSASTPGVAPIPVGTPGVAIPKVCVPYDLVCAGPYAIPPQGVTSTPAVPGLGFSQTTPGIEPVPILGVTPFPPPTTVPLPATASVGASVGATSASAFAAPDSVKTVDPTTFVVPTPFGGFPVTVCASKCNLPTPLAAGASTSVSASAHAAGYGASHDVPYLIILP